MSTEVKPISILMKKYANLEMIHIFDWKLEGIKKEHSQ